MNQVGIINKDLNVMDNIDLDEEKKEGAEKILEKLLENRGYKNKKQKQEFLNFDYEKDLHSPHLMSGVKRAVSIISKAIDDKSKIVVYGDYDADGVCASTVIYETLLALGVDKKNIIVYIPNRNDDGYGMNIPSLEVLKKQGAELVITVDLGSTNIKEAEWLKKNNIQLIITDHHIVQEKQPKPNAFINPHKKNDKYPYKYICGAAVAFKLCVALLDYQRKNNKEAPQVGWEKWLLDVVAIATIADVMPLLDENRTIVKYGLFVLSKTKRKGLLNLLEVSGMNIQQEQGTINTNITAEDIGFSIAPRINAAGRIADAKIAFDTIISDNYVESKKLALQLDKLNRKRKDEVDKILKDIEGKNLNENSAIVAGGEEWMLGVVGIVAGRLAEKYGKPSFIYQIKDEHITGSARTPKAFNTIDILKNAEDVLEKFGGHKQAGGFTALLKNEKKFSKQIIQAVDDMSKNIKPDIELKEDIDVSMGDISLQLCEEIEKMEPYGQDNNEPLFLLRNIEIKNSQLIGENQKHLRCYITNGKKSYKAIGFNMGQEIVQNVDEGDRVDVFFHLQKDEYKGVVDIMIKIVKIVYE